MVKRQEWTSRITVPNAMNERERIVWDRLCGTEPHLRSAFYSFAFVQAVASVRSDVYIAVIERDGEPVAFLPFQFSGRVAKLLGAAEPIGGNMTDYFGLVAERDVSLTTQRLLRLSRLSSLLFTHLDESQFGYGLTGERPEPGLRIEFPAGADAYWAALRTTDRHFVSDTERRERRLIDKVGELRFQLHLAEPAALLQLIDQKRQQYAQTGVADVLAVQWRRELLLRLLSSGDPLCNGVLSVLWAGETWAASHFGLRCENVMHHWFPVYNHQLRAYAPGRLLLRYLIRDLASDGVIAIDCGAGDVPAKRDFASTSHNYYRGLWSQPGLRSLCFRSSMSLRWRISRIKPAFDGDETSASEAPRIHAQKRSSHW